MTDFTTGHIPDPRDTSFTEDLAKAQWPESWMRERIAELEAADAAIAELEAELAALKARRCDECDSREADSHYCLLWSINTPDSHACNDWADADPAAREEGS